MKLDALPLIGILLGIVLLTTSAALPSFLPTGWDDKQAAEFADAGARVHNLSYGGHDHSHDRGAAGHVEPVAIDPPSELAEAQRDYERRKADLERAQSRGSGTAWALRWLGILATIAGVGGYVAQRLRGSEE